MPARQLYGYLRSLRIGSRTGIPGYGESAGFLDPWQTWLPIHRDNIAFGQGVGVDAVQMAAAINTIANGGVYVQPSLVKGSATTFLGQDTGSDHSTHHRVVSTHAAHLTRNMMEMVPAPQEGTAPAASIQG